MGDFEKIVLAGMFTIIASWGSVWIAHHLKNPPPKTGAPFPREAPEPINVGEAVVVVAGGSVLFFAALKFFEWLFPLSYVY